MKRAHTPPTTAPGTTPPAQPGTRPDAEHSTDLVAGNPPVPITVWRTPTGNDQASIPTRLAQRLVAAYSRPGEAVVDLTDDHALTDATLRAGRRHYPGWFTDAAALIIGASTRLGAESDADTPTRVATVGRRRDVDLPEVAAWFGDDLIEDLPPHDGTVPHSGAGTVQAATSLVVAGWPLHALDATNQARLRWLLHAGVRLLRPGGCLVLLVRAPAGTTATPEDFGPLVNAAADVGLGYLQHIVAVRADVDGDQFTYYATDEELLALAHSGQQWAVAHLTVHADLLVLTPRQTASTGGGGARG
jgi:hypothetical protein